MRRFRFSAPLLALALTCLGLAATVRADVALHALWELHGKHNTVYILGSIHVLRPSDYPLSPAVLDAYSSAKSLFMEVNLQEIDSQQMQSELLASALLPAGNSLPSILGKQRYDRAGALARDVGVELSTFDQFAPWFAAEAISVLQLTQLGFQPESGVEMYFLERARVDGKTVAGLETVRDQIALFDAMSMDAQAEYLVTSLEQARDLPKEVDAMVHAWQRGDTAWFESQLKSELGSQAVSIRPGGAQPQVGAENRGVAQRRSELSGDRRHRTSRGSGQRAGPAKKRRDRRHPALI
jgi:hypothetical protein